MLFNIKKHKKDVKLFKNVTHITIGEIKTARYLANKNKKEIHDLENEKVGCKIKEIKAEHKIPLQTIADVERFIRELDYNGCKWCLPQYHTD